MKLTLGPLLYYWPRDQVFDFYRQAADWPVTVVYLGEAVCSRRRLLKLDDWLEIATGLAAAGKQVVLSTLALMEAESELLALRRLIESDVSLVEANDLGAVNLCAAAGRPFVIGPHVNVYNPQTLRVLYEAGARRWVPPVELSGEAVGAMKAAAPPGLEIEVFAYGRLPLALSARCFTARHHRLPKDDCGFRCLDYPEGLVVKSQEGEGFLALNGIQTQSARLANLLPDLPDLAAKGVDLLRLSPHPFRMQRVVEQFRQGIDDLAAGAAADCGNELPTAPYCDGYWRGEAGIAWKEA